MPDAIARLSDAVARAPAGLAWVALAEALRRARRLADAERIALRGLERHPYHADGHDILARVHADRGDASRARDEWEMALQLAPGHVGALLGLGWLALRAGDRVTAGRRWEAARAAAPDDPRVAAAARQLQERRPPPPTAPGRRRFVNGRPAPRPRRRHRRVPRAADGARPGALGRDDAHAAALAAAAQAAAAQAAAPKEPPPPKRRRPTAAAQAAAAPVVGARALPAVFAGLEQGGALVALLADADGLVLAGEARDAFGRDRSEELAAELAALSGDAARALRQLHLGEWERVQVECEGATLALAPGGGETVTLVVTDARTPAGVPRRLLDRAQRQAAAWLESL